MLADELDFLTDDDAVARQEAADALAAVRADLAQWAADALLQRHPDARAWRGRKGLLLCRQDMDFHVKHIHTALESGSAQELRAYAAWWPQVLATRGSHPGDVAIGAGVLHEALLRFLPSAAAKLACQAWGDAFPQRAVASPSHAR
jgi:hypothetical protein